MNLFLDYQKKIFNILKTLEKKNVIKIPTDFKNILVQLPPKNKKADMSCNAAMILAKSNNTSPLNLAEIIKKHLLMEFKEFNNIEVAEPGFLNICFKNLFWKEYLTKIIKMNTSYGSAKSIRKKYNIEFVSANPTGPLHVGHCRGAVLGDVLSNILNFNGNKVTKEYYVNDSGEQIKNFVEQQCYPLNIDIVNDGEKILDTGGGIYNLIKDDKEENFLTFNPDTLWNSKDIEIVENMQKYYFKNKIKNLLMVVKKNRSFDTRFKGDFTLKNYKLSKDINNDFIYTGCQIFNKKIFNNINKKIFSMTEIWNQLLIEKELYGFESFNKFLHITDIEIFKKLS